jgi:hypothetical protein
MQYVLSFEKKNTLSEPFFYYWEAEKYITEEFCFRLAACSTAKFEK